MGEKFIITPFPKNQIVNFCYKKLEYDNTQKIDKRRILN